MGRADGCHLIDFDQAIRQIAFRGGAVQIVQH
jgi:hypothetical protein